MVSRKPPAPPGLGPSGRRLWRAIVDERALRAHELVLLTQAVRTVDGIDWLQSIADDPEESTVERRRALAELRGQRTLLDRLLGSLVPATTRVPVPSTTGALAMLRRAHGPAPARHVRHLEAGGS